MEKTTPTKQSVAEIITDQIIQSLNAGIVPWTNSNLKPYNAKSSRVYTGLNRFLLAGPTKKFEDQRFLTFNEIKALKGEILDDEKGHIVFFTSNGEPIKEKESLYQQCEKCKHGKTCRLSDEKAKWQIEQALLGDEAELCEDFIEKQLFISKYYKLWNIQQTTLKDDKKFKEDLQLTATIAINPDEFVDAMEQTGLKIDYVTKNSGYEPDVDKIHLLPQHNFTDINKFYAHQFRLNALACGHEKRLNLKYLRDAASLYDYGTIVSEMVAVIMCGECGININYKRSADYITGLVAVLKKDPKFIIMAGNSSNRVVKYLQDVRNKMLSQAA